MASEPPSSADSRGTSNLLSNARAADEIVRTVSSDGSAAIRALVATGLVGEAGLRHSASPTAADALGRGLMGGLLLSAGLRKGATVQLQFSGDGPVGAMTVIANDQDEVRGFVSNPQAQALTHPPHGSAGSDDLGVMGRGVLSVVRNQPSWREPQRGIVPMKTGTVAKDITHYLTESEQTPAAVALGVSTDASGRVEAAGGFLVHALPGADDEVLARLESNVHAIESTSRLVLDGADGDAIVDLLLAGIGSAERHRAPVRFHCHCGRDRVGQVVSLLGREEILEMIARDEPLEIRCEFCASVYTLGSDELQALLPDV